MAACSLAPEDRGVLLNLGANGLLTRRRISPGQAQGHLDSRNDLHE